MCQAIDEMIKDAKEEASRITAERTGIVTAFDVAKL